MTRAEPGGGGRPRCGRYGLLRELGRGGQGVVYLAHDPALQRRVAIKVLAPGREPDAGRRARFEQELRAAARVEQGVACEVYETGAWAGRPYLVMEYVEGRSLERLLASERERQPDVPRGAELERALARVEGIARAVHIAHECGVVHRDLKPSNVVLRPDGRPALLDFGLAALREPDHGRTTRDGERFGTPAYMAPEQVSPVYGGTGPHTDVYALGVLLYESVLRRPPFEEPTQHELFRSILWREPVLDRRALAPGLVRLLGSALAKEPQHRPASALEFADELARVRRGARPRSRPPGIAVRVRRWSRANPMLAAAAACLGAALLLTVAALAAWSAALSGAARGEQRRADRAELPRLLARAEDESSPGRPGAVARIDAWLASARALAARASLPPADSSRAWVELLDRLAVAIDDVTARREAAVELGRASLGHRDWPATSAAIAAAPAYGGLRLAPQWGLVPLGPDPGSGLFEFAHLPSGAPPVRDADGRLVRDAGTALVLVLVPGGRFEMGTPLVGARSWPSTESERPVHSVELGPCFVSKYEMTRAQWRRAGGETRFEVADPGEEARLPEFPVRAVSWRRATDRLARLGLLLPTEAQWEYAARAGTAWPWSFSEDARGIERYANTADRTYCVSDGASKAARAVAGERAEPLPEHDDGYGWLAPVGSFLPNAFGLHDVHGNVRELCRDPLAPYTLPVLGPYGVRAGADPTLRVARGGTFTDGAENVRSAVRWESSVNHGGHNGLRPARPIEP